MHASQSARKSFPQPSKKDCVKKTVPDLILVKMFSQEGSALCAPEHSTAFRYHTNEEEASY